MQHTDQDMLQTLIDLEKYTAVQLTNMAMECSDDSLRRLVMATLDQTLKHQREVWHIMNRKGWYTTHQPSSEDYAKAKNELNVLGLS